MQHSYFHKPVMVLSRAQCLPCYVVISYAADAGVEGYAGHCARPVSDIISNGATDTRLDVPAIRKTSDTSIKNAALFRHTQIQVLGSLTTKTTMTI